MKYFACGWCTTIAEVDCSGSSCDPSEIVNSICSTSAVDGGVYKIVGPPPVPILSWPFAVLLAAGLLVTGAVQSSIALRTRRTSSSGS